MKDDAKTRLMNDVADRLENGIRPWVQPWSSPGFTRPLRYNFVPYRGINVVSLWMASAAKGLSSPVWMSYKQGQELGGQVRKGEKASTVFFASTYTKTEAGDAGEEIERDIPFLKAYSVFNASQIDGLPGHFYAVDPPKVNPDEKRPELDAYFENTGAVIEYGGDKACYIPSQDKVRIPLFEQFNSAADFLNTKAHEIVGHWTGHESRLNRTFGKWASEQYALEEMVGEAAASLWCSDHGLETKVSDDSASYIAHYARIARAQPNAIFHAIAQAEKAVQFTDSLQPKPEAPAP